MIGTLLFLAFIALMLLGVPIGAALGLAGAAAIALANAETQWFGLLAVPQNFYAGLGKYPLLAIPMFVLVGSIFDRSGVALRLVNFADRDRRPRARHAAGGGHRRRDVPRRHLRLGPGQCRRGGRRDDRGHGARRLSAGRSRPAWSVPRRPPTS